jgi:hypothetical protein
MNFLPGPAELLLILLQHFLDVIQPGQRKTIIFAKANRARRAIQKKQRLSVGPDDVNMGGPVIVG